MIVFVAFAAFALVAWVVVLVLPGRRIGCASGSRLIRPAPDDDLSAVTVLIPARDEAGSIGRTIAALGAQGRNLGVVVVDDQSSDGTADVARAAARRCSDRVAVIAGRPLPEGWAGKLWALEQGLGAVDRPYVLLLDADIELAPRLVPTLLALARERDASLVSIMAALNCTAFWERLLTPAFVFFFKLLYPFAAATIRRDARRRRPADACSCAPTALRRSAASRRYVPALIDDCTLAASREAAPAADLARRQSFGAELARVRRTRDFWQMVSRSAFTQLRYSAAVLIGTTVLMAVMLLAPVAVFLAAPGSQGAAVFGALAVAAMGATYRPVVRFYGLPGSWALTLPVAAVLFLAMTWTSAVNYWRGTRATWKNRSYESPL